MSVFTSVWLPLSQSASCPLQAKASAEELAKKAAEMTKEAAEDAEETEEVSDEGSTSNEEE